MNLFRYLDLETMSRCNRHCPTCIRNSHPDREALESWLEPNYMPVSVIRQALKECDKLGFMGEVCLSHYNEPLMDERLPMICELSKSYFPTYFHTNGDFLSEELARCLDGKVNKIIVSLYQEEPIKSKRAEWIRTLFHKSEMVVNTQSDHIATHFSPKFDVVALAKQNIDNPCIDPSLHCIINHRGQYLLCCDDVIGNFGFSTFPKMSIEDYWFGGKHSEMVESLLEQGGRRLYPYCSTCPRQ